MAMRTYLLAIVIGLTVGTIGSAFHYCLEMAPGLYSWVASRFSGDTMSPALVSALLSATTVGSRIYSGAPLTGIVLVAERLQASSCYRR